MSLPPLGPRKQSVSFLPINSPSQANGKLQTQPIASAIASIDHSLSKSTISERLLSVRQLVFTKFESKQILNKEAIFFLHLFKINYSLDISLLPVTLYFTDHLKLKITRDFKKNYPSLCLSPDYLDLFLTFLNENIGLLRLLTKKSPQITIELIIKSIFEKNLPLTEENIINLCIVFEVISKEVDCHLDKDEFIKTLTKTKEAKILQLIQNPNTQLFRFLIKNFETPNPVESILEVFAKHFPIALQTVVHKSKLQHEIQKLSPFFLAAKKLIANPHLPQLDCKSLVKFFLKQDIRLNNSSEVALKILMILILSDIEEKKIPLIRHIQFELISKRVLLHSLINKQNTQLLTQEQLIHVETLALHMVLQPSQELFSYIKSIANMRCTINEVSIKKALFAIVLDSKGFLDPQNLLIESIKKLLTYFEPHKDLPSEESAHNIALFFCVTSKKLPLFDNEEDFWHELINGENDFGGYRESFVNLTQFLRKELKKQFISLTEEIEKKLCFLDYSKMIESSQIVNKSFFSKELIFALEIVMDFIKDELFSLKELIDWLKPHIEALNAESIVLHHAHFIPEIKERLKNIHTTYNSIHPSEIIFQTQIWLQSSDLVMAFFRPLIAIDTSTFCEDSPDFGSLLYKSWWLSKKSTKSPYVLALEYASNYVWNNNDRKHNDLNALLKKVKAIAEIHYPSLPFDENIVQTCFFRFKQKVIKDCIKKALSHFQDQICNEKLFKIISRDLHKRERLSENEVEGIKKELKSIRNATLFDLTVQSWEQYHLELPIEGICEDILRQFSLRYSPDSNDKEECQKSLSRLRTSSLEFLTRKIYQNPLVKISDDEIAYIILENFKDHVMEREGDLEQIKSFIKSYPK